MDEEADLYELNLRQRDARRTILLGGVLHLFGISLLVAWLLVIWALVMLVPDPRLSTGLLAAGGFFTVLGGATFLQGLRKRREWRQRRGQLIQ
jgi:hypothetical protein